MKRVTSTILGGLALVTLAGCASQGVRGPRNFGMIETPSGEQTAQLYTLDNGEMRAVVTNLGAAVVDLYVPNGEGEVVDVSLGHDNAEAYTDRDRTPYFGATVGRVANRIARGQFTLDGQQYQIPTNNGVNTLHGGDRGFDQYLWDARKVDDARGPAIEFTMTSPDDDQGYPGEVEVTCRYVLTPENALLVEYTATTSEPTPINLANHTYFNLSGHDSGSIEDHVVRINAAQYTPVDEGLIPTGIESVSGTPFDLRQPTQLGEGLREEKATEPNNPNAGFDHNWVISPTPVVRFPGVEEQLRYAAEISDDGRTLRVYSNQPGLQFYTGNFLDGSITGKDGAVYEQHAGFCVETQKFPDAINRRGQPGWPNVVVRPGETYHHVVVYDFSGKQR